MPQNPPRDEKWLLRRIDELERRIRTLETAPRAGNASISGGKLTVGDPASADRIELDAAEQEIAFRSTDVDVQLSAFSGDVGVALEASTEAGQVLPVPTFAYLWNGATLTKIAVTNPDASGLDAFVAAGFIETGGQVAANAQILAHSEDAPNDSFIEMDADGGVVIFSYGRTTDPPSPGGDRAVLYVKNNRLWVRDSAGARQL